jgi:hypothetical protein
MAIHNILTNAYNIAKYYPIMHLYCDIFWLCVESALLGPLPNNFFNGVRDQLEEYKDRKQSAEYELPGAEYELPGAENELPDNYNLFDKNKAVMIFKLDEEGRPQYEQEGLPEEAEPQYEQEGLPEEAEQEELPEEAFELANKTDRFDEDQEQPTGIRMFGQEDPMLKKYMKYKMKYNNYKKQLSRQRN